MRRFAILFLLLGFSVVGTGLWNFVSVFQPVADKQQADPRNEGIEVWVHYQYFLNPGRLVFDLRNVDGEKALLDVQRMLMQSADALKERRFDTVVLQYRGTDRFVLQGEYFQTLGQEYGVQNPMYTARTFAENVFEVNGTPAFGTRTGGLLSVTSKQMEDFTEFHRRWYLADMTF